MVANHYVTNSIPRPENTSFMKTINPANNPINTNPSSARELTSRLRRCENTAPGPDGITYNHIKFLDPKATILTPL